jgi:acetoin utilization protein AcuC
LANSKLIDITGLSFHEKAKQYDLEENHPFRGDRFSNAMKYFKQQGLLSNPLIRLLHPEPASKNDLLRVHSEEYVNMIYDLAQKRRPYDIETPVTPEILEAALYMCGSAMRCGKAVMKNEVRRAVSIGGGYHHAGRDYGGGFCIFNDVAVLTEYLRAKFGIQRFLILDYDVHFGNGTSDIYYRDPTVLYISLHQDPYTLYPGTGFVYQIGEGKGTGYNVNVPLPPGTGDSTYLYALNEIFAPLAQEFAPEIIIANGGSDSHYADSLAQLALTANGFFRLSKVIRQTAEKVCNGKLILLIGSGYNPEVLPLCWYALLAGAVDIENITLKEPGTAPQEPPQCRKMVEKTLDELKRLLRKHWTCLDGFAISGVN